MKKAKTNKTVKARQQRRKPLAAAHGSAATLKRGLGEMAISCALSDTVTALRKLVDAMEVLTARVTTQFAKPPNSVLNGKGSV